MGIMRQTINNRGHKVNVADTSTFDRLNNLKNKEKRKLQHKKRYDEKREHILKLRNESGKILYVKQRTSLMKTLGGMFCNQCGYDTNILALQIDHILNTGHLDKKRFHRRDQMFRHYIEHPMEAKKYLQVLCANCNQIRIWSKKPENL